MKRIGLFILLLSVMTIQLYAQQEVKLWQDSPATAVDTTLNETTLYIYSPEREKNTGMAVIICPGGGYARLAMEHEGIQMAEWLQSQGITGIILQYRLPNKNKEIPLQDAQGAISYVRRQAEDLQIDPGMVGIMGFSAGGHLASTASTHFSAEDRSDRPDFSVLFYPVVTMREWTHGGSRTNLLGDNPSEEDIRLYSNEERVSADTPPTILLLSDDDKGVVPRNSIEYYTRLKAFGIPASLYIFPEGGHGWGMRTNFKYHQEMTTLLSAWLLRINKQLSK
ncbi:alpha/beta hydrolase [Bacteroidales bacterium OttesenSCG-928-L03]|nr:alpha/beta hydrolase [Bacteroidales bacterium OttesenSCG-928-L03]